MADHLLLKISATINAKQKVVRFFVKTFPNNTYPVMQKYIRESNAFDKEIFVYTTVLPKLKQTDFAAVCFYAKNNTIILEDLTENNYQLCGLQEFDDAHVKLTLQTIATIHACSIAYEEQNEPLATQFSITDGINRKDENFTGFHYLQAAHKGVLLAADLLQKTTIKNHLNQTFNEIFNQHTTHKNVFNHGDLWPMNILFQYENGAPKHCKLVDYQLIRYSPPANDVLYFLLHALHRKNFKTHLPLYLQFYYTSLYAIVERFGFNLKRILPLKDFQTTCDLLLGPLKLKHTYQVMLQYANNSYMKDVYKSSERYTKCLFEDRSEMVESLMATDVGYKEIVQELLEDLEEIVENRLNGRLNISIPIN